MIELRLWLWLIWNNTRHWCYSISRFVWHNKHTTRHVHGYEWFQCYTAATCVTGRRPLPGRWIEIEIISKCKQTPKKREEEKKQNRLAAVVMSQFNAKHSRIKKQCQNMLPVPSLLSSSLTFPVNSLFFVFKRWHFLLSE